MSVSERRKTPRYPIRADVAIEWGSQVLKVSISDISLSGMFINTSDPLWLGAEFSARVLLEDPVEVHCAVRRVVPRQGMGVEFLNLADSSRGKLERLFTQLAV